MASRARQISLRECYEILGVEKGADLQAVKTAYRKRAFELHPDLNPNNADSSRQFQRLNEAYVALSAMLKPMEEARAAHAEEKPKAKTTHAYQEQDVLADLLKDPFARRVFEDIYSELNKKQEPPKAPPPPPPPPKPEPPKMEEPAKPQKIRVAPLWEKGQDKGVKGMVKDWLRKQIDEEQTLVLPATRLAPGRKVRLQIRRGMSDAVSAVEVTLPSDFQIGKPMRLRGLGKRVGPWQGDLYLTIHTR